MVDIVSLVVSLAALGVTIAIFFLGRRLSFRQQRERVRELEAKAWEVLGPIRTQGLNSKIIVINVARYVRGYDGSNQSTLRGWAFSGPELIEISHGGVDVIIRGVESYYDAQGRAPDGAPVRSRTGHTAWSVRSPPRSGSHTPASQ